MFRYLKWKWLGFYWPAKDVAKFLGTCYALLTPSWFPLHGIFGRFHQKRLAEHQRVERMREYRKTHPLPKKGPPYSYSIDFSDEVRTPEPEDNIRH